MKLTLDVENTVTKRAGKLQLDPYEYENELVMVGMLDDQGNETIVTFEHSEVAPTHHGYTTVQNKLNEATVLIGHNIGHDLVWLWESGFRYDGPVFDTMMMEYLILRGVKQPLSLEACALRYELDTKKQDTLKAYLKQGVSVRDIPHAELSEYLSADLHATQQLAHELRVKLVGTEASGMHNVAHLTNQMVITLAKIYDRGFKVDMTALEGVRIAFEEERKEVLLYLEGKVRELMGDVPLNLSSPEQLSTLIYSRKPMNKSTWINKIDPYMGQTAFKQLIREETDVVFKSHVKRCADCYGSGKLRKEKKDGTPYSKQSKCNSCGGNGYHVIPTSTIGGLKFNAPNAKWATANGFSTNRKNLELLANSARSKGLTDALEFLEKVQRLSALDTYLSSFVGGIANNVKSDGMLHVRLNQHMTSTGRLSGKEPNMQNMPRGGTFPVKRVFVSRFNGGKILEADFAQLEFRVAAYLSQDPIAIKEVTEGFDVHAYTAKIITDAGQTTSRQDAKAHTFAPLYGASGYGRSKAEAAYYTHFTEKYKGIADWHNTLAKEALNTGKITTPSGREFSFPDVQRNARGRISYFTQIKNYPVQSFATADIVPVALQWIETLLKGNKSCVVNTVHDSIVIDVHPEEEDQVLTAIDDCNTNLYMYIKQDLGVDINVPLLLESKIGNNWLDIKDVA
jgi:DNA polymerase I-like protein with 3'-5' exonuclease and polymerase domains|tara:strand:- start:700 stop:2742 length:2043 start_codon:yes stop_codon:yes gene_type:complete